jgi:hypothetical protein
MSRRKLSPTRSVSDGKVPNFFNASKNASGAGFFAPVMSKEIT